MVTSWKQSDKLPGVLARGQAKYPHLGVKGPWAVLQPRREGRAICERAKVRPEGIIVALDSPQGPTGREAERERQREGGEAAAWGPGARGGS